MLKQLQVVIIVPTRLLAGQVSRVAEQLVSGGTKRRRDNPIVIATAVGDDNPTLMNQLRDAPPHILIGTPDIIHLILMERRLLSMNDMRMLILDEADHLLVKSSSQPFVRPLLDAMRLLRPKRNAIIDDCIARGISYSTRPSQIAMVSATITTAVQEAAHQYMNNDRVHVHVNDLRTRSRARMNNTDNTNTDNNNNTTSSISSNSLGLLNRLPKGIGHQLVAIERYPSRESITTWLLAGIRAAHPSPIFGAALIFLNASTGVKERMSSLAQRLKRNGSPTIIITNITVSYHVSSISPI
jgi:superfamily II DNA/RNA helicase